jgi:hypothetical protein
VASYTEMREAVRAYIRKHQDLDPRDIFWVIPLALRRDEPAVRDMPGPDSDALIMIRGILGGWWLHGPGRGHLPPGPRESNKPPPA